MDTMKERERLLIETRYNNTVKTNIERNNYISDLDNWAKKGFATTRSTKRAVNLSTSPELEKMAKIANGTMKDPSKAQAENAS